MSKQTAIFSGSLSDVGRRQSLLSPRFVGLMRRLGLTTAVVGAVGVSLLGYAFGEAHSPTLRRYRIQVPARPGFTGLRLLHISDLHMFPGQQFIADFLQRVAEQEDIDLVISTGDNLGDKDSIDLLLEAHDPLLGFPGAFVLGSNDYYSPKSKSWLSYFNRERREETYRNQRTTPDLPWLTLVNHLSEAGWVDLSNRTDSLTVSGMSVALAGVDDPHIRRDRMPVLTEGAWQDPQALRLALTHAPYRRVLNAFTNAEADLILAGHTHGGQVRVPGIGALVTNSDLPVRYSRGMHCWHGANHSAYLHVSAGMGTSPYAPIRFACRPEASLIEVVPA